MSGNSLCRRLQTAPIVRGRSRPMSAGAVAISALQEGQLVLADLHLVAVLELGALDAAPVDVGAVEAPLVVEREALGVAGHDRVAPGDGHVVQEDLAFGTAPERRPVLLEGEGLPRPAAARADDERRPLDAKVGERERVILGRLL